MHQFRIRFKHFKMTVWTFHMKHGNYKNQSQVGESHVSSDFFRIQTFRGFLVHWHKKANCCAHGTFIICLQWMNSCCSLKMRVKMSFRKGQCTNKKENTILQKHNMNREFKLKSKKIKNRNTVKKLINTSEKNKHPLANGRLVFF